MRILVRTAENERKSRHFRIVVPNAMFGWRWVWRAAQRHGGVKIKPELAQKLTAELRRYVRQNGHFYLVDVRSKEGDEIRIRV